jgi:hypothetical protein
MLFLKNPPTSVGGFLSKRGSTDLVGVGFRFQVWVRRLLQRRAVGPKLKLVVRPPNGILKTNRLGIVKGAILAQSAT